MFKFSNIKKLFSYNWSKLVKDIIPKGNETNVIDESAYKDIKNGAIVRIISVIFSKVATIGLAIWIVVKAYKAIYGGEILSYAISSVLSESAGEYIVEIISASIIPIAILIYNMVMKNKKQSYWPYFIVLIYALVQTIYSLFGIFGWLASLIASPIFAILGLVSILLTFLGNVHIAVGCIDFCMKRQNQNVQNANTQTQNYSPIGSYQPTQEVINQNLGQSQVQNNLSNISLESNQQVQANNVVPPVSYTGPNNFQPDNQNNHVAENNIQNNQNVVIQKRFCTNCGQPITPGSTNCPFCNHTLN